jgi:Protein of unknown function (DUF3617)
MTKTFSSGLIMAAALALASSASAGTLKAQPGMWTTVVKNSTAAGTTAAPVTETRCLTQGDVDDFANKLADTKSPDQESCERSSFKETANSVDFTYECTGRFPINGGGSFKFDKPTHYVGQVTTKGIIMGQTINNTTHVEGTRTGPCK